MVVSSHVILVLRITLFTLLVTAAIAHDKKNNKRVGGGGDRTTQGVTYDAKSLIINGRREFLFAGAIHYPRSTVDMWPEHLRRAKQGGLNAIQTYVFWNAHEPVRGQYNFEGNLDLVKFIKMVAEFDMYVILRIGPFIQAEWNHGGLPFWLRTIPNITFRSDNKPFKHHMKRFVSLIVNKMKAEKLYASQGGPIIVSQIENEYNSIQLAFREKGKSYINWAAKLAISLKTGVPWVMCKQNDAPDPIINACNGRHCGDTSIGPNKPYKPFLWTENWTAQYRVFGDPPSLRSAEDLAFSVARFYSKNGSMVSYYMYHGGTNFGRTSAAFTPPQYYDEAPLDEYGLPREPKWSHLKHVHKAISLCKKAILWGTARSVQKISEDLEARVFERPGTPICAAFLTNNDTVNPQTMEFRGQKFKLPPHSISILPDCKTVVYNTHMITNQHNSRNYVKSEIANKKLEWKKYKEQIPTQLGYKSKTPRELYTLTQDTTDYAWYTTSITLDAGDFLDGKSNQSLLVASLGHALLAFVNGKFVGNGHGSKAEKSFLFNKPITLTQGVNNITILGNIVGFPDSGAYMEHRFTGPHAIAILGLQTRTLDITANWWGHQVGLDGEHKNIFTSEGEKQVEWTEPSGDRQPLTWYKAYFDAPEGNNPVSIRMSGMGKGIIWVNGHNLGRYWMSYLNALNESTQSEYHIPRAYIKPTENLVVVLEEEGGDPKDIEILLADRNTICSLVTQHHPPSVTMYASKGGILKAKSNDVRPKVELRCPHQKQVVAVEFASFGDPFGACGNFTQGNCTSPVSKEVVEKYCMGRVSCQIPLDAEEFRKLDPCPGVDKALAVQLKCAHSHRIRAV